MARKRKAASTNSTNATQQDSNNQTSLVPYEIERLQIIERNRERLRALGIPAIAKKLDAITGPIAGSSEKPVAKRSKKKKEKKVQVKLEDVEEGSNERGARRSTRLRVKAEQPVKEEEETVEDRFERQLGEFLVDGTCPKCGKVYERAHKRHLMNCTGPKSPAYRYAARDKELLAELTEEELKDQRKRMLARTKALNLDGLVDFNKDSVTFIVIGSRGDPYTIKITDEKRTCTCLDHRFRRHDCKHILLVLSQLNILEELERWHEAVGQHLDELIKKEEDDDDSWPAETLPGPSKTAAVAMKFV